jgi:hypothetical protein
LVLLEASSACLGAVEVCPHTSEGVCSGEDEEDLFAKSAIWLS